MNNEMRKGCNRMELNRREFIKAGACAIAAQGAAQNASDHPYQIGAYYFPNWHVDPRNEAVHGKGWTEWEILKRGEPKFAGHLQPKRPLWGMKDESNPDIFEQKIAAAGAAGINHFIFDWYWYEGEPFLHRALESGYLRAANKHQLKFCLMWANHEWVNLFPARLREQPPRLLSGTYDAAAFDKISDYIVSHYFVESSYFKVDDSPYFSIYELKRLIDNLGGLSATQAAFERLRRKTQAAGFPDLHFNATAWGLEGLPDLPMLLPSLGIKSVTSYTWAHYCKMPAFPVNEYADMFEQVEAYWKGANKRFGVPYHTDVSMGWDPSPRTCQSDCFESADYPFLPILRGNAPQLFEAALRRAKAFVDHTPGAPKILTVNSWNEWTEGSFLEPESLYGTAYLDSIRSVFGA